VNVTRDKKIDAAVAVVIGPGGAGAESAGAYSGLFGYVFKLAVAQVVIERVAAVAGDVNILQAVVVVIGYGHAHAPAFVSQSRGAGDVGEVDFVILKISILRVAILMIERDHQIAARAIALHCGTVDRDDVELAVVVAIDQPDAAAHRFDDVFFIGRRNVRNCEASFLREVFELRQGFRFFFRRTRRSFGWSNLCRKDPR